MSGLVVETFRSLASDQPEGRRFLAMLTLEGNSIDKRGYRRASVVMPFYGETEDEAHDAAVAFVKAERARAAERDAKVEKAEAERAAKKRISDVEA